MVEVQNAGDFSTLQSFRQQLSVWSAGVREVGSPSLAGGTGKLEVTYLGTAERLAEQIDGKSLGKRKVSVTGVSGNALEVKLGK